MTLQLELRIASITNVPEFVSAAATPTAQQNGLDQQQPQRSSPLHEQVPYCCRVIEDLSLLVSLGKLASFPVGSPSSSHSSRSDNSDCKRLLRHTTSATPLSSLLSVDLCDATLLSLPAGDIKDAALKITLVATTAVTSHGKAAGLRQQQHGNANTTLNPPVPTTLVAVTPRVAGSTSSTTNSGEQQPSSSVVDGHSALSKARRREDKRQQQDDAIGIVKLPLAAVLNKGPVCVAFHPRTSSRVTPRVEASSSSAAAGAASSSALALAPQQQHQQHRLAYGGLGFVTFNVSLTHCATQAPPPLPRLLGAAALDPLQRPRDGAAATTVCAAAAPADSVLVSSPSTATSDEGFLYSLVFDILVVYMKIADVLSMRSKAKTLLLVGMAVLVFLSEIYAIGLAALLIALAAVLYGAHSSTMCAAAQRSTELQQELRSGKGAGTWRLAQLEHELFQEGESADEVKEIEESSGQQQLVAERQQQQQHERLFSSCATRRSPFLYLHPLPHLDQQGVAMCWQQQEQQADRGSPVAAERKANTLPYDSHSKNTLLAMTNAVARALTWYRLGCLPEAVSQLALALRFAASAHLLGRGGFTISVVAALLAYMVLGVEVFFLVGAVLVFVVVPFKMSGFDPAQRPTMQPQELENITSSNSSRSGAAVALIGGYAMTSACAIRHGFNVLRFYCCLRWLGQPGPFSKKFRVSRVIRVLPPPPTAPPQADAVASVGVIAPLPALGAANAAAAPSTATRVAASQERHDTTAFALLTGAVASGPPDATAQPTLQRHTSSFIRWGGTGAASGDFLEQTSVFGGSPHPQEPQHHQQHHAQEQQHHAPHQLPASIFTVPPVGVGGAPAGAERGRSQSMYPGMPAAAAFERFNSGGGAAPAASLTAATAEGAEGAEHPQLTPKHGTSGVVPNLRALGQQPHIARRSTSYNVQPPSHVTAGGATASDHPLLLLLPPELQQHLGAAGGAATATTASYTYVRPSKAAFALLRFDFSTKAVAGVAPATPPAAAAVASRLVVMQSVRRMYKAIDAFHTQQQHNHKEQPPLQSPTKAPAAATQATTAVAAATSIDAQTLVALVSDTLSEIQGTATGVAFFKSTTATPSSSVERSFSVDRVLSPHWCVPNAHAMPNFLPHPAATSDTAPVAAKASESAATHVVRLDPKQRNAATCTKEILKCQMFALLSIAWLDGYRAPMFATPAAAATTATPAGDSSSASSSRLNAAATTSSSKVSLFFLVPLAEDTTTTTTAAAASGSSACSSPLCFLSEAALLPQPHGSACPPSLRHALVDACRDAAAQPSLPQTPTLPAIAAPAGGEPATAATAATAQGGGVSTSVVLSLVSAFRERVEKKS